LGFELANHARADRPFIVPLPNLNEPKTSYKDRDSEGIASVPDKKKPEAVAAPGFDSL
jgi:hypothetical protein